MCVSCDMGVNLRVQGRLISQCVLAVMVGVGWISLAVFSKQGNEFSGEIKLQ